MTVPQEIATVQADLAKTTTDTEVLNVTPPVTNPSVTALLATLATATSEAAALTAVPVSAAPPPPVVTLNGSVASWTVPTANPPVTGINVYVGGVKVLWSNWQDGVPTSLDLSKAPSSTVWGGTLPIPAAGQSESVQFTCYSNLDESTTRSNAVIYTTPKTVSGLIILGSYDGSQGQWASTTAFGVETGCKVSTRTEYLNPGPSSGWMGDLEYLTGLWQGCPYTMRLGIPLVPNAYPPVFSVAESLVPLHKQIAAYLASQQQNATWKIGSLRPNWELNIGTTSDMKVDPAGGIEAWNLIVPIYKAEGFLIECNTCPQQYWDVLTFICSQILANYDIQSWDPYDQSYATPLPQNKPNTSGNTTAQVWSTINGGVDGGAALATFARANGKAMCIAECGVGVKSGGYGLGDDPTFIQNLLAHVSANIDLYTKPGGYLSYFDAFPSGWDTKLGDSPLSLAEWQKIGLALFGAVAAAAAA
jgi:hypothetical protein